MISGQKSINQPATEALGNVQIAKTKGINSGNDHIRRYYKLLEYPNQSIEP